MTTKTPSSNPFFVLAAILALMAGGMWASRSIGDNGYQSHVTPVIETVQKGVASYLTKNPEATNLDWHYADEEPKNDHELNDDPEWKKSIKLTDYDKIESIDIKIQKSLKDDSPGTADEYVILVSYDHYLGEDPPGVYDSRTGKITFPKEDK